MIRTLRVTSVVAGLLAVGLLAFFSVYGVKGDQEVDRMVTAPTVIEQLKDKPAASTRASPTSVLDDLAKAFARTVNPPRQTGSDPNGGPIPPRPQLPKPSAKFRLIATSYNPADPNLSLAFIDLSTADRRQFWARVGHSIEHYKIMEIRDGSILYGDGQRTQEIAVEERPARVSLLETGEPRPTQDPASTAGGTTAGAPTPSVKSPMARPATLRNGRLPYRASLGDTGAIRPQSEKDIQAVERMVENLRSRDANEGPLSQEQQKVRQEAMEKLVSYIQAARMSQQEANSLGDLGRQLDGTRVRADVDINGIQ